MGQYDDGFDFEDEQDNRQQLSGKALRDARDKAAAENAELKKQLADLTKQVTERNLKDVLQAKSLPMGLAKWMTVDGIDGSDTSAVDKWLTDNAETIGYKPTPEEPAETDSRAAEFARMQGVQVNALPAGKLAEAASRVANADSIADVNAALRSAL